MSLAVHTSLALKNISVVVARKSSFDASRRVARAAVTGVALVNNSRAIGFLDSPSYGTRQRLISTSELTTDSRQEAAMGSLDTLTGRNAKFAKSDGFNPGLKMLPKLKTIVIGCVDGRVDPADVLGLEAGEVVVIRNVGGRVTADVLLELAILRMVSQKAGGDVGKGWEIVVMQHHDCGITRVATTPELAKFLGVDADAMDGLSVTDPHQAVKVDLAVLKADPRISDDVVLSGLVYDVKTGLVEKV